MKSLRYALCALVFVCAAQARPIVIEEVSTLAPPDASWQYFGRFGVAIDGDWALVSGERVIEDPNAEGGQRSEVAAFLYRRSGTSWTYSGQLGPVVSIDDLLGPGLAMKGGVAMTDFGGAKIFERTGTTWTQAPLATDPSFGLTGPDIEIDGGRILVQTTHCTFDSVVLRKSGGTWAVEGELHGHAADCIESMPPAVMQDLQGERAVVFNPPGENATMPERVRQYRLDGSVWSEYGGVSNGSVGNILGPPVALAGPYLAIAGNRERGTGVVYEVNGSAGGWAYYGLQPVDSFLEPDPWSTVAIERVGTMFAQRNYSFDRKAYVVNVFRVNDDEVRSSTQVASLQAKQGGSLGGHLDTSGNRIIVSGWGPAHGTLRTVGDNKVRVFELPASFDQAPVQVHDFETSSAGAVWQRAPGSTFGIVKVAGTGVYRQPSTAGDASSWLPDSTAGNQAIQAEVIIRAVDGADRWAGLMTRRLDDSNYYYVTLRTSGSVQLKKLVSGVVTTLASASTNVVVGRKYRLRLESIGTRHRVYINDVLTLNAYDAALTEGTAGVTMFKAYTDYDNVIVTPNPFTTIYAQTFSTSNPGAWRIPEGTWQSSGGVFHQTYNGGYARTNIGALTDDQVVQARIRPLSFVEPDNWVGLTARYQDERNHLYVSLRGRGVISLWRRTNNVIQQLATAPFTVTPGAWYRVRVEIVNNLTRVFVDDQLRLSTNADPGPATPFVDWSRGSVGLVTYRATADFDSFLAYQP
jgi:hypothetical protein